MIEEIKNIQSKKKDIRKFGLTVGLMLIFFGTFLFCKEKQSFQYFITIGIILFFCGVIIPVILKPIYLIWMIFATILGWIMTMIILSILFYFMFAPIGLIARFFGKHFLELKWNRSQDTYWHLRITKQLERHSYEKQF